jgi:hypothetical protein
VLSGPAFVHVILFSDTICSNLGGSCNEFVK